MIKKARALFYFFAEQVHVQVLLALQTSAAMDDLLYETDSLSLSAEQAARLRDLFSRHCALVNGLHRHYVTVEGKLLFNVTFKLHWLDHAVSRACFISPRHSTRRSCLFPPKINICIFVDHNLATQV